MEAAARHVLEQRSTAQELKVSARRRRVAAAIRTWPRVGGGLVDGGGLGALWNVAPSRVLGVRRVRDRCSRLGPLIALDLMIRAAKVAPTGCCINALVLSNFFVGSLQTFSCWFNGLGARIARERRELERALQLQC